jgi:hypothetical protein
MQQAYETFEKQNNLKQNLNLLESEVNLILYIRSLKWGSIEITVQNSEPVFAKSAYKTIKFKTEQKEDSE